MTPTSSKELDDIFEDLIVGHNFDYAREQVETLISQAITKATEALLERVEREVIGEDEEYAKVDLMGCGYYHEDVKNWLKAEQRERLNRIRGKS